MLDMILLRMIFHGMKKYHINVSIDKNILSDDMIQLFETNNIKINIWTINNKDQLYNFTNKGIKICNK